MGSIRFAEFELDAGTRQLLRRGAPVEISPKALQLLQTLIAASPSVVTKEQIVDTLWPDVVVEEANVRNLIAEVRAALGDEPLIRTVHRVGYAFTGSKRERRIARLVDGLETHYLCDGANVIGRDPSCEVQLVTTGVSRRHARITIEPDRVTLEDLESKNGTWCNG